MPLLATRLCFSEGFTIRLKQALYDSSVERARTVSRRPFIRRTYCRDKVSSERDLAEEAAVMYWKRFRPIAEKVEKEVSVREVHTTFTSAVKFKMWGPHSV